MLWAQGSLAVFADDGAEKWRDSGFRKTKEAGTDMQGRGRMGAKVLKQWEGVPGPPRPQVPTAHSEVVRAAGAPAPREQLVPVAFSGSQVRLVGVDHFSFGLSWLLCSHFNFSCVQNFPEVA